MIVFCDGCNTPYHRFCHHPPIDQAVIDEVDKEWYCTQCEKARVVPVPESEISSYISAPGASIEQVSLPIYEVVAIQRLTIFTETAILRELTARHVGNTTYESHDS